MLLLLQHLTCEVPVMNYHQIYSTPRHLRYIFFVDATILYSDLVELMKQNLGFWGGAFNPIVPIKDGVIAEGYIEIIKHIDPDIIYHSSSVDVQIIKDLGLFNPWKYVNVEAIPQGISIAGVSRSHLLTFFDRSRPLIVPANLSSSDSILLDYFELNFGVRRQAYAGDGQAVYGQMVLHMGPEYLKDFHYFIHTNKPVDYAGLASLYLYTKVLRSFNHVSHKATELVIAAGTSDTSDLLYWWNRRLYEGKKIFFVTKPQLAELVKDQYFGKALADNCETVIINVISFSLSQLEVEEIINTFLKPLNSGRKFRYTPVTSFPYPVDDANGFIQDVEHDPAKLTTLLAGESHLPVAAPAFISNTSFSTDTWAVDTQICSVSESGRTRELRLPKTSNVAHFIGNTPGRVNGQRRLTFYFGSNTPYRPATIELNRMPTFSAMLQQLISQPIADAGLRYTDYKHIEVGEPGRRLQSFFRLSGGDLTVVEQYLSDKFWYELLMYCCKSEKLAGDSLSFKQLLGKCRRYVENQGVDAEEGKLSQSIVQIIEEYLKPRVEQLVAMKVLLPGYTFSCTNCGHTAWYSLEDVTVSIRCNGCLDHFSLPVDPDISYRLTTLVKRNFYQTPQTPDGNAVVIRTLLSLASRTPNSFDFSGQVDLYSYKKNGKETDLDIVALQEGEFTIGEAKNDSSQFFKNDMECLRQLYWVAFQIRPDRVVLCCAQDSKNKLNAAKAYLEKLFGNDKTRPTVEAILLTAPTSSMFNVSGRRSSEV